MTMNDLVVGASNRAAVELAKRVVANPGNEMMNPFVIVGESGTGKTAILDAMVAELANTRPYDKVVMWSAHQFLDNWIRSLGDSQMDVFRDMLMTFDVFLLDECEFLFDKRNFQREFRNALTGMLRKGCQIVIATTSRIAKITGEEFDIGLKGRLSSGVEVELTLPDAEMRKAFVHKMLANSGIAMSDKPEINLDDVDDFWALGGAVRSWVAKERHLGN